LSDSDPALGLPADASDAERSVLGALRCQENHTVLHIDASVLPRKKATWAKTAQEINASANACLDRFYKQVKGGKELDVKANGVLVMPGVIKAGMIVGGEYGEGALRVGGQTVSDYNLASGSAGFQIGGEAKDIVVLFKPERSSTVAGISRCAAFRARRPCGAVLPPEQLADIRS